MFDPKVEDLLNKQIVAEAYSANLYLSMSAWFRDKNLDGYANWFYVQYKEEMDHSLIIYNYVLNAGGQVKLGAIDAPPTEFGGVRDILKQSLEHEQLVTSLIYAINDAALGVKDYKTVQFLDWFIQEQVEEEDNASTNIGRFDLFGEDPKGLYSLDEEMNGRSYTQTPQVAHYENEGA
ncbi:MAG: ferritin [Clostridiales Family XIII bacterium]|jgi:ferritin|nr:ferritin [Clostridiales Family XIII bacterium]